MPTPLAPETVARLLLTCLSCTRTSSVLLLLLLLHAYFDLALHLTGNCCAVAAISVRAILGSYYNSQKPWPDPAALRLFLIRSLPTTKLKSPMPYDTRTSKKWFPLPPVTHPHSPRFDRHLHPPPVSPTSPPISQNPILSPNSTSTRTRNNRD